MATTFRLRRSDSGSALRDGALLRELEPVSPTFGGTVGASPAYARAGVSDARAAVLATAARARTRASEARATVGVRSSRPTVGDS